MIKLVFLYSFIFIACGCQSSKPASSLDDTLRNQDPTKLVEWSPDYINIALENMKEIQSSLRMMLLMSSKSVFHDSALKSSDEFDEKFNALSLEIVGLLTQDTFTNMLRSYAPHVQLDQGYVEQRVNEFSIKRDELWMILMKDNNIQSSFSKIYPTN